jgi:hypothetical protein
MIWKEKEYVCVDKGDTMTFIAIDLMADAFLFSKLDKQFHEQAEIVMFIEDCRADMFRQIEAMIPIIEQSNTQSILEIPPSHTAIKHKMVPCLDLITPSETIN